MFDRNEMLAALKQSVCLVRFIKTDGTPRGMECTLIPDVVSETFVPSQKPRPENNDIIRVYDIELRGWRSFRVDSVTHFEVL